MLRRVVPALPAGVRAFSSSGGGSSFAVAVPALAAGLGLGWFAHGQYSGYAYKQSLAGRVGRVVNNEDVQMIKAASVKFSTSEVRNLYAALPKWDVTFFEFKGALAKLDRHPMSDEEAMAFFRLFDVNGDGKLSAMEFVTVLSVFARGTDKERAEFLFRIWDADGDGRISRKDFRESYKKMDKGRILGRVWSSVLFAIADQNSDGVLTIDEFVSHPATVGIATKIMLNRDYRKFVSEENFPELARVVSEEYSRSRAGGGRGTVKE